MSTPERLVVGSMDIFEGIPKAPIGETPPLYGLPVVASSALNPDQWLLFDRKGNIVARGGEWPVPVLGSKRITDARHVCLLCEFHHRTWAPSHSRLILAWLADREDALERSRHDEEEDR